MPEMKLPTKDGNNVQYNVLKNCMELILDNIKCLYIISLIKKQYEKAELICQIEA